MFHPISCGHVERVNVTESRVAIPEHIKRLSRLGVVVREYAREHLIFSIFPRRKVVGMTLAYDGIGVHATRQSAPLNKLASALRRFTNPSDTLRVLSGKVS